LLFVGIRKEEDHMGDTWHPKEEREKEQDFVKASRKRRPTCLGHQVF